MSWRAAAAFLPLLALSSFVAACGGDNASISPTVRIVLEADLSQVQDVDADSVLKAAADIIGRRVGDYGANANVHREGGTGLTVELAGIGAEDAQELTGQTAFLEFRQPKFDWNGDALLCEGGTVTYSPPGCNGGQEVPIPRDSLKTPSYEGVFPPPTPRDSSTNQTYESIIWVPATATDVGGQEVALTGRFLKANTFMSGDPTTGLPILNFEMTSEGSGLLKQVTTRLLGLPMTFFLDGEPIRGNDGRIIAPTVREVITDKGIIQGLAVDDVRMLSILLNSGALPVPLKVVNVQELGD